MAYGILIIEDETILAKNMRLYLERSGFEARTTESAEEGLQFIREFRPDVLILDFQLPGRNGLDLLAELRRTDPGIPIIMLTGQASVDMAVEAMKLGAVDFLTKPLALGKLKQVIDKVLGAERTEKTLAYYRDRDSQGSGIARLLGDSPPMRQLKSMVHRLLEAEAALGDDEPPAVLITGETGAGKEVLAKAIHYDGPRKGGPFIELNCGSIPPQLLEAELFGHERGAFTDAKERKLGLVEAADGGTLFLDEIGDMSLPLQAKLLRVLQEREIEPLGSNKVIRVDVRIIAATSRDLIGLVRDKQFRADLYYRLNVVPITLPPLRDRPEDIESIADRILEQLSIQQGTPPRELLESAVQVLREYDWPGNVRELYNTLERVVALTDAPILTAPHIRSVLPGMQHPAGATALAPAQLGARPLSEVLHAAERIAIAAALEEAGGVKARAAKLLGISRASLYERMVSLGLGATQ